MRNRSSLYLSLSLENGWPPPFIVAGSVMTMMDQWSQNLDFFSKSTTVWLNWATSVLGGSDLFRYSRDSCKLVGPRRLAATPLLRDDSIRKYNETQRRVAEALREIFHLWKKDKNALGQEVSEGMHCAIESLCVYFINETKTWKLTNSGPDYFYFVFPSFWVKDFNRVRRLFFTLK